MFRIAWEVPTYRGYIYTSRIDNRIETKAFRYATRTPYFYQGGDTPMLSPLLLLRRPARWITRCEGGERVETSARTSPAVPSPMFLYCHSMRIVYRIGVGFLRGSDPIRSDPESSHGRGLTFLGAKDLWPVELLNCRAVGYYDKFTSMLTSALAHRNADQVA